MEYRSAFHPLKKFLRIVEQKIPLNVKIVAEVRLIWKDIVGEKMASRSQVVKCEYLPQKNSEGKSTGEFHRRLLVQVKDSPTQVAMISYVGEYLERLPKRLRIHSFRFQHTHQEFNVLVKPLPPQTPKIYLDKKEKQKIIDKVQSLHLAPDMEDTMINYLIVWKDLQVKRISSKKSHYES